MRGNTKHDRNYVRNKSDGAKTRTPLERQRWSEWIGKRCSVTQARKEPKIMHIQEHTWRKLKNGPTEHEIHEIPEELTQVRINSKLHTLTREIPSTKEWITRPYTHEEITKTLKR